MDEIDLTFCCHGIEIVTVVQKKADQIESSGY